MYARMRWLFQALIDKLHEIEQQLTQANIICKEMCTTLTFKSQVQMGHIGLDAVEGTIDSLLRRNDSRVIISCVAGKKQLTSVEHLGSDAKAKSKLQGNESGNWKNRELFEIEAEGARVFFCIFIHSCPKSFSWLLTSWP